MSEQSKSIIAKNLKAMREYTDYSVEMLADLLDVDTELISEWEAGIEEPTLSQSLLLSKLYGVSMDDLFYNVQIEECIPKEKQKKFTYNARVNRLLQKKFCL